MQSKGLSRVFSNTTVQKLGIHTEETRIERDTCTPMFIAALFIIDKTWKQTYAEYIMRNTGLEETQTGIKIAGRNINNLRYADDPYGRK